MIPQPRELPYSGVEPGAASGTGLAGFAFTVAFLYCWISINPFENLQVPPTSASALNQLAGFALTLGLFCYAAMRGLLPMLMRPRWIIVLVFLWLAFTTALGAEAMIGLRRLFFTGLLCACASIVLLIPRSREQFAYLIGLCAAIVLGLSYAGAIIIPGRAVHQAYDLVEPNLAGDWRGVFNHKNVAAPAMAILAFVGLYLASVSTRAMRGLIFVLALLFLWLSNGKTALGMFPLAMLLAFAAVRAPRLGGVLLLLSLGIISAVTLSSALSPSMHRFLGGLGIDPTFTARTDIWKLALESAAQHPILGFGFGSFWGSDMLTNSNLASETWAVDAAHAHNGFIEVLLGGGVPALLLVSVWLVFLPLRDIARAEWRGADRALTMLFARIWVFVILCALLESNFFTGTGPMWFSLLLAVFGLRQQAAGYLLVERDKV